MPKALEILLYVLAPLSWGLLTGWLFKRLVSLRRRFASGEEDSNP